MNPIEFARSLGFTNISMNREKVMFLSDFQGIGVFMDPPLSPVNFFKEKDLLNCTLTIYEKEKYLIRKNTTILACNSQLKILPKVEFGTLSYFDHGDTKYSDEPCRETVVVTTNLTDENAIRTILPYLQSIPKYTYNSSN